MASPIDLIPEFLPVIGPLDDTVVVVLALRYAGRRIGGRDQLAGVSFSVLFAGLVGGGRWAASRVPV
ncbi:DUF1232 domain-containing protein [Polymorphospora sp. NPDC051019]|uniref:YkvA family protein n=1 Tax=Polymorphospora sp. NPDC051019 TaxID=3155725 RepID=UPI003446B54E